MINLPIVELYLIKNRIIKEGLQNDSFYDEICESIKIKENMINEDEGGASCGMGAVTSSQPSSLAGSTMGPNWSGGGGTTGSGDISMPYNTGGSFGQQKVPMQMGMGHGSRTGKKTRKKRMTMKTIQNMRSALSNRQDYTKSSGEKKSRVMSFDDFQKDDINKIKK
jgi:hypothetical protein